MSHDSCIRLDLLDSLPTFTILHNCNEACDLSLGRIIVTIAASKYIWYTVDMEHMSLTYNAMAAFNPYIECIYSHVKFENTGNRKRSN